MKPQHRDRYLGKAPWGTDNGLRYIYSVVETDIAGNPKDTWKDADDPQTHIQHHL